MNILALDLSLTRTGYALPDGTAGVLIPPRGEDRGVRRLAWIESEVVRLASREDADLVVIEGYSFGSKGAAVFNVAELGGVVRLALYRHGRTFVEVSPSTLKTVATGKGNAPKELVLVEAVKRLGYTGSDNNEADALWLRQVALHALALPARVELPKTHLRGLDKIDWPRLASAA